MRPTTRRFSLALLAGAMTALLAFAPAAALAKAKSHPPTTAGQEKRQNTGIKNLGSLGTKHTAQINDAATKITKITSDLATTNSGLGTANGSITSLQNSLSGLTAAFSSASTQITAALTATGAGLTAVGAGLTTLSHVTTSQTLIAAQVYTGGTVAADKVAGCFVTAGPLSFTGNQSVTTISCPAIQIAGDPAGTNAPAAGGTIHVVADCRSNKTNVTGASAPCALAGITSVTVNESPATGTTGPLPAPNGMFTSSPNIALGGAPLYPFVNKTPIPDLTGAGGTNNAAAPLSFTTNDAAANQVDLTTVGTNASLAGALAPALPTCTAGTCVSQINVTIRGVDSNPQLG